MGLIQMMDDLLRNRGPIFEGVREGRGLGAVCGRLLLVFLATTALYGAVMGAFRPLHPEFFLLLVPLSWPSCLHKPSALCTLDIMAILAES